MTTVEGQLEFSWIPDGEDFSYVTDEDGEGTNLRNVIRLCEEIHKLMKLICKGDRPLSLQLELDEEEGKPSIVKEREIDTKANAALESLALTKTEYRARYDDIQDALRALDREDLHLPPKPSEDGDELALQLVLADSTGTAEPPAVIGKKYREVDGKVECYSERGVYVGVANSGSFLRFGLPSLQGGADTFARIEFTLLDE